MNPLVSIIIPCYNSEKYIQQSVDSALNQSHTNIEVIIVDDGSQDGSWAILQRFNGNPKVLLLQHEEGKNKGVSATRKLAVKHAKGSFIAFLDADDVFMAEKVALQLEVFKAHPSVVLVHSKVSLTNTTTYNYINEFDFEVKNEPYRYDNHKTWLKSNHICNSTVMVKADVLHKFDFSIKQIYQFEDWLLWSLLSQEGDYFYIDKPLIQYLLHDTSATASILKNNIVSEYSRLEYLFNFFALTSSPIIKDKLVIEVKETLDRLMRIYNPEACIDFNPRLRIEQAGTDQFVLLQKYDQLTIEHAKLKEEYNKIESFKNSKLYKIYSLLRK